MRCVAAVSGCECSPLTEWELERLDWIESGNHCIRCPFVEQVKAGVGVAATMRLEIKWIEGNLAESRNRGVVQMRWASVPFHVEQCAGSLDA